MKVKYLLYGIIPTLLLGVGISSATAHGMFGWRGQADPAAMAVEQTQRFEHQAEVLGVSVEQVKEYWTKGMSPRDIIEELDLDETAIQNRMREIRQTNMKEHLQVLVDQGVLTQAQADTRLEFMSSHEPNLGESKSKGIFGQRQGQRGNKGMGCQFIK
jgi:hypothetical protein